MLRYGIKPADVKGWLFLAAPQGLKLAKITNGSPGAGALEGLLRREIRRWNLDIVCLDPFVKMHSMGENDTDVFDKPFFVAGLILSGAPACVRRPAGHAKC